MLELLRSIREGFPDSTVGFITTVAVIAAVCGGGLAWVADGAYRRGVARENASKPTPVSAAEIEQRRQLRIRVGELLKRGRIHQHNLQGFLQGRQRSADVGALATTIYQWHIDVTKFFGERFGQAEADRIGVPPPSPNYPRNVTRLPADQGGSTKGTYDLRSPWDFVFHDLPALEKLLNDYPELR